MSQRNISALLVLLISCFATPAILAADDARSDPKLLQRLSQTMAMDTNQADAFDAQVWLMTMDPKLGKYVADPGERLRILKLTYREAHRNEIDPDLALAVMQVESAFDHFAVSRAGAQGLMQVMPFWRLEIGRPQDNLTQIDTNIRYGITILTHYIEKSNGDLIDALARYNGSRGRLKYPERVVKAWRRNWQTRLAHEIPELQRGCKDYRLAACRPF